MRVLFMMPILTAPSEEWMQRMLDEIGDNISAVASSHTDGIKEWRGHKVLYLGLPHTLLSRILHCFGILGKSPEKTLLHLIRHSRITHVLCQYGTYAVQFMNVWQSCDVPLSVHFHGYDATFNLRTHTNPSLSVHPMDYQSKIVDLSQRALFIANSEFTKSNLIQAGVTPSKIIVKYLGVPVPKEKKAHTQKKQLTILQLGRLVDFKSPDRTILAFEIARSNGLNAELIIAGDGPLRITCELYRARSKYKDAIHILGEVSPTVAHELLASADIYTQHNIKGDVSNQEEALGVSILEAMAFGLPVIGTKSGGVTETVVNGETGILIEPGDVSAQAAALFTLGTDTQLRRRMGEHGRERISERFSFEIERKNLYQILGLPFAHRL